MKQQIIFLQGGGSEDDYDADSSLVASLQSKLGLGYAIEYPLLPNDGTPDLGRRKQITKLITDAEDNVIVVGHSLGASMLLVTLSERKIQRKIGGLFLLAPPFWQGDEDWVRAFELKHDFEKRIDEEIPLFLYHCLDDDVVPFDHFEIYKQHLPWATFREIPLGGHQFSNDLTIVANDIRNLD